MIGAPTGAASSLKARGTPWLFQTDLRRTRKRVVLVAYDIPAGGIKQIIDFRLTNGETRAAVRAYHAWAACWHDRYPEAVACVDRDLEELLAVFDVPAEHRRMVRTTNGIERCFRGVRRRTDSIGTFVNDASIERILYGLVAYRNAPYAPRVCREFRKLRHVA